jgi:hypothetical protein
MSFRLNLVHVESYVPFIVALASKRHTFVRVFICPNDPSIFTASMTQYIESSVLALGEISL